jgi:hypothetical protein
VNAMCGTWFLGDRGHPYRRLETVATPPPIVGALGGASGAHHFIFWLLLLFLLFSILLSNLLHGLCMLHVFTTMTYFSTIYPSANQFCILSQC